MPCPALDGEDRLAPRDAAGELGELARVAERLDVEHHDLGRGRPPTIEQVVRGDVGLVADETNADKPRPRDSAASSMASPSAPLWDEKPMFPDGAWRDAKVAFSRVAADATPRQFGPMRRAP